MKYNKCYNDKKNTVSRRKGKEVLLVNTLKFWKLNLVQFRGSNVSLRRDLNLDDILG